MDKNVSYSCVTNDRTYHIYFIIRIFNGCELWIENSVTTVTVQHREVCRVMLSDGTFSLHQTTVMGSSSCILFLRQIRACKVNGSILGPGLIRHRSVQPFFQSVLHI